MSIDEVKMRQLKALEAAYAPMSGDKAKIDTESEVSVFLGSAKTVLGDDYDEEMLKETFGLSVTKKEESKTYAADASQNAADTAKAADKKAASKKAKTPADEVMAAFEEARGYDAEKDTYAKTLKEAYKAVEEKFTDKKTYTKEQRKQYEATLKEIKKGIKTKGDITQAEVERIQRKVYNDYKSNTTTTSQVSYDDTVDREVRYATTKSGDVDKRVARSLKGRHGTWLERAARTVTATVSEARYTNHALTAVQNSQAIKNKKYTADELTALLGEANQVLLQKYVDDSGKEHENVLMYAGLVTKDKDGKYDITKLSDLVLGAVGKEHTLTDHDEDKVSENTAVWDKLGAAFRAKAADPSKPIMSKLYPDNQTEAMKSLATSLGYFDDAKLKKIERAVKQGEKEAVKGAVIGGAAAAATGRIKVHQDQRVEIPLDGQTEEEIAELMSSLQAGGGSVEIIRTATGILIHQEQLVKLSMLKNIALGVSIGGIIGGALGAIEELCKHSREFHALYLDISCCELEGKTPEEQKKLILGKINDAKNVSEDEKSELRKLLLLGYQKDSKGEYVLDEKCNPIWDGCTFQEELKKIGGNIVANSLEVKFAGWDAQNAEEQIKAKQTDCNPTNVATYNASQKTSTDETKEQDECDVTVRGDINFPESNQYGWKEIIQMYYSDCLVKHSEKEIRFAIRKANNIPNNLHYVPANLLLPYQLFEGEDECTRTEKKDVQKGNYDVEIVKTSVKTPDGEWQGGIICRKQDGTQTTTWLSTKHKTKEAAEAAARALITPAKE